jgi:hypothetical protein
MTDDLRLRTAWALGWEQRQRWTSANGDLYEDWYKPDGCGWTFGAREDGSIDYDTAMPAYGLTWASCEEIDAAIKERGWNYSVRAQAVSVAVHGPLCVVRIEMPARSGIRKRTRCISEEQAPTFPAAFALAFCQAVEANGE